jgi:hypothetical protein
MRTKAEIVKAIEDLAQERGFVYTLGTILCRDFFLDPSKADTVNWRDHLSFQEISFLVGLMVKAPIDRKVLPSYEDFDRQLEGSYKLFQELHLSHNQPYFDALHDAAGAGTELDPAAITAATSKVFAGGEMMAEPIFYGGSGAYDFQYLQFAISKYGGDADWLRQNKGFSIETAVEISKTLKRLTERRRRSLKEPDSFEAACRDLLSVFTFRVEDLSAFEPNEVSAFLSAFSAVPGETNKTFNTVGAYNAIESHPIVALGNGEFLLAVGFALCQSIYESPYYWMQHDIAYRARALRNRGDYVELTSHSLLANVFGPGRVFRDVRVERRKGENVTDADVLVLLGNRAIVVQAKSKRLTELARQGRDEPLRADFSKAIQAAYGQGMKCREALFARDAVLRKVDGTILELEHPIEDAYILCVTADHYPAVLHQVDSYLEKEAIDPYPIAMSVFDLDMVAFYLHDPYDFLYYVHQRVALSSYFKAASEIALLAFHLKQKLYKGEADREVIDEAFAQLLDANFPVARGEVVDNPSANRFRRKWANSKFDELVEAAKSIDDPKIVDALFFLYDIAGAGADELIGAMEATRRRASTNGRGGDFSAVYDQGKSGISFIVAPSLEQLGDMMMAHAVSRKYKTKADKWLALGTTIHSAQVVDAMAFNDDSWEEDAELQRLSERVLVKGTTIRGESTKIGRNDRCLCGSGLKFKRCCGKG